MRAVIGSIALLAAAIVAVISIGGPGAASSVEGRATGARSSPCTARVGDVAALEREAANAAAGSVICLRAGRYDGPIALIGDRKADVTVQAAPGAHVSTGAITIGGSSLVVRGLWIDGEVTLEEGSAQITLDHNDITGGGEGVVFATSDCSAPNAPGWEGCAPHAPITSVTISGNRFHDIGEKGSEDAIHLDNWRKVTISGNEFEHIVESGNHTDCVQSVYGGSTLSFNHNYEHDDDCQGFFVKDGDVSDVSFTENLFLRDNQPSGDGRRYADLTQFWNIHDLKIERNTIWDDKGIVLAAEAAQVSPSARVTHNLLSYFALRPPVGTPYALSESFNVFATTPTPPARGAGERRVRSPRFADTKRDDYRLAHNPHGIGVDWSPAHTHYGPWQ